MALSTEAARIVWSLATNGGNSTAVNTLDIDAGFTIDPQVIVDEAADAYGDVIVALMTDEWNLLSTTLYVPDGGGTIPFTNNGGRTGGTGTPVPPGVALLMTKQTNTGGRRGKGRMFIPGISQTQVNGDGIVASGFLATARANVETLRTRLTALGSSVQPVVHTRASGGLPAGNTLITKFWVEQEVATQRKRQRR